MDSLVVWLARNGDSGPIILASNGGEPKKITTDGIDYLLATLQYPEEIYGFEDNYAKIENDCEGMRYAAKEQGFLDSVFNEYLEDTNGNSETCYAYFGVVTR